MRHKKTTAKERRRKKGALGLGPLALGTAGARELFEAHMTWAAESAGKYKVSARASGWVGRDEMEQAAMIGLWQAARSFKPRKLADGSTDVAAFKGYAKWRIFGEITDCWRNNSEMTKARARANGTAPHMRRFALDKDGDPMTPAVLGREGSGVGGQGSDDSEAAEKILNLLKPGRDREIFKRYVVDEILMKNVAAEFEMCEARASQIVQRCVKLLRERLGKLRITN